MGNKIWEITVKTLIETDETNDDPGHWSVGALMEEIHNRGQEGRVEVTSTQMLLVPAVDAVESEKRSYRCGHCGKNGHAASRCPVAPKAADHG